MPEVECPYNFEACPDSFTCEYYPDAGDDPELEDPHDYWLPGDPVQMPLWDDDEDFCAVEGTDIKL
jgi:hypothetical protein